MTSPDKPPKVSTFSRVLAWVFVFFSMLGIPAFICQVYAGSWSLSWSLTIFSAIGALFGCSLFIPVALTGRPPRWWASIEEMIDFEKALRRNIDKRNRR
jgi:hypothetical protein